MNNNEMISKIITLTAVSARIEKAGVVSDIDRSIINHLTSLDLPFAEAIDTYDLVEHLDDVTAGLERELPENYREYLNTL